MTLLARLVDTSQRVSATSARLVKVRELAACPRAREPGEIDIGVQYLSGEARQERFGIGHAVLQAVSAGSAARNATLTLADVDRRLTEIAGMRGAGMTARRSAALRQLFSLTTAAEQEFLIRAVPIKSRHVRRDTAQPKETLMASRGCCLTRSRHSSPPVS